MIKQHPYVSLFFTGDSLVPAEISSALGCKPTTSGRKGDPINHTSQRTGQVISRPAFRGYWGIDKHFEELGQMENAVKILLKKATSDIAVWNSLSTKFECSLICNNVLSEENELHLTVGPLLLHELVTRGLKLTINATSG
jgi:hypothetical protein